jgi:hypothetical protein
MARGRKIPTVRFLDTADAAVPRHLDVQTSAVALTVLALEFDASFMRHAPFSPSGGGGFFYAVDLARKWAGLGFVDSSARTLASERGCATAAKCALRRRRSG